MRKMLEKYKDIKKKKKKIMTIILQNFETLGTKLENGENFKEQIGLLTLKI
jgi:2-iminoacetate synthase ThiH